MAMILNGNELFWGNLDWKDRVENRFEASIREARKAILGTIKEKSFNKNTILDRSA